MGIMNPRSKLLMTMWTVLAIAWTAQAKNPKPQKPASSSEADEVVTTQNEIPTTPKTPAARHATDVRPAKTGQWRIPVGLSYMSGLGDMVDYYKDRLHATGNMIPVGLSLAPHYEFAHGSRLGVDLGPAAILLVNSDVKYWDVPLALSYGFTFIPRASVSPYVRGGVKYHIANGDDVDRSKPGLFGAAGVEFLRKSAVGVELEVGYDGSEIEIAGQTFKTGEILVSLRAVF
jgi:hypothetical protein